MSRTSCTSIILALCIGSSGCSFLFVKRPPSHPEEVPPTEPIDCTRGKAAPIIDSIVAGVQVARVGFAATADDSVYQDATLSRGADIGLGLALAALYAGSAAYGFATTSKCADVKANRFHYQDTSTLRGPDVSEGESGSKEWADRVFDGPR